MMTKFRLSSAGAAVAILLALPGAASAAQAQVTHARPGQALTAPSKAEPASIVRAYLRNRGLGEATVGSLRDAGASTSRSGLVHLRLEQQVDGLTVHGSYVKAAVNARGQLVHLIDRVAAVPGARPAPASIGPRQALEAAMARVHPDVKASYSELGRSGNTSSFAGGSFFHEDPSVTTVAVARSDGKLETAYLVQTWSDKRNLLNHTLVSGAGKVLSVELRTQSDSYNVFLNDPDKGPQTVVAGPAPSPTAPSPNGWLSGPLLLQKTTKIMGNNVKAYLDSDDNNRPDAGGVRAPGGNFLTPVDLMVSPTTDANRAVAVQNLFYLNNIVHDRVYPLGFDEASGNFQKDNFGKGGAGNDAVNAEAHDGSGTDNANFATPPDGRKPRMQMYLWTGAGQTHEVVANVPALGSFNATPAAWGAQLDPTGITANVQIANDGTGVSNTDACEANLSPMTGMIALVDRGTCAFTIKAKNVQNAGAVGVMVVNNEAGNGVFVMGGEDATVTIPGLMVGNTDGTTLRSAAGLNISMRQMPVLPLQIDASLDADIVFHEFGHGLTWRLIGGMSGPLAGAIGEGAADGLAMLINGDDRIAEYSASDPIGIRRNPYAGYPRTYADVTGAGVHNDGEIFAAIVWRMIELFGPSGNQALFGHYVDGMKFTPATPAYEDMRNGMLASMAAAGASASQCALVWQAYAQFGVGDGASGVVNPDGVSVTITPSFTARTDCSH